MNNQIQKDIQELGRVYRYQAHLIESVQPYIPETEFWKLLQAADDKIEVIKRRISERLF